MSDLGEIGVTYREMTHLRLLAHAPVSRILTLGETVQWLAGLSSRDTLPVHSVVDAPIPSAGLKSLECYAPGSFVFLRPVDSGTTVTISVKARKNADYVGSLRTQGQVSPRSLLPYLELERSDGRLVRDTMADVTDTWDTLTAEWAILETGVMVIRLVQEGTLGDSTLFSSERSRIPGPKCWWADLVALVT